MKTRAKKTSSDITRFKAFRHTFRSGAALWIRLTARARDPCSERASERLARARNEPAIRVCLLDRRRRRRRPPSQVDELPPPDLARRRRALVSHSPPAMRAQYQLLLRERRNRKQGDLKAGVRRRARKRERAGGHRRRSIAAAFFFVLPVSFNSFNSQRHRRLRRRG